MSKKRKTNEVDEVDEAYEANEAKWFVTVIPLKLQKYFICFHEDEGLDKMFECLWCMQFGIDVEKEVATEVCYSEHQAFWTCYRKFVELVEIYGIDNVRSDVFQDFELSPAVISHIDGLVKHKVKVNFYEVTCERCLRVGHSQEVCFVESRNDGEVIDRSAESSSSGSSDE